MCVDPYCEEVRDFGAPTSVMVVPEGGDAPLSEADTFESEGDDAMVNGILFTSR